MRHSPELWHLWFGPWSSMTKQTHTHYSRFRNQLAFCGLSLTSLGWQPLSLPRSSRYPTFGAYSERTAKLNGQWLWMCMMLSCIFRLIKRRRICVESKLDPISMSARSLYSDCHRHPLFARKCLQQSSEISYNIYHLESLIFYILTTFYFSQSPNKPYMQSSYISCNFVTYPRYLLTWKSLLQFHNNS